MKKQAVYFDHSATTPVDNQVQAYMQSIYEQAMFNPAAVYKPGQIALNQLWVAKRMVAKKLDVDAEKIFFTGCASESNNLIIKGLCFKNMKAQPDKKIILMGIGEHSSAIKSALFLEEFFGYQVLDLPTDNTGLVDLKNFKNMLSDKVLLVVASHGASEIGTLQPISQMAEICEAAGVFLHIDASQSPDFFDIYPGKWGIDSLTLSSHKIYGPKGVGLIYLKDKDKIEPLLHGGSQEAGLRAGTENILSISGFASALEHCFDKQQAAKTTTVTRYLREKLATNFADIIFTGHHQQRLPFHISLIVPQLKSHQLLMQLDIKNICASAGSACNSGQIGPAKVLLKLGYNKNQAESALRLSLGRSSTTEQADYFVDSLKQILKDI